MAGHLGWYPCSAFQHPALYVHNDVVRWPSVPAEKQILVKPASLSSFSSSASSLTHGCLPSICRTLLHGLPNYGAVWRLAGWNDQLGKPTMCFPADRPWLNSLFQPRHRLGLHTTTLIAVRVQLDPGFQVSLTKGHALLLPCDGPGRGAPAISQAWTPFLPVGFWALPIPSVGPTSLALESTSQSWQGNVAQFNRIKAPSEGWFSRLPLAQQLPANTYNAVRDEHLAAGLDFPLRHLVWATGFKFSIPGGATGRKLIRDHRPGRTSAHRSPTVWLACKPLHSPIVSSPLVGLSRTSLWVTSLTYGAFLIASTSGSSLNASLPPKFRGTNLNLPPGYCWVFFIGKDCRLPPNLSVCPSVLLAAGPGSALLCVWPQSLLPLRALCPTQPRSLWAGKTHDIQ